MTDFFVCEFVFLATFTKKGITQIESLLYFFPDVPQEKVIKVIPDDLLSPSSEVGPSNITSKQPNTDTSRPIE